MKARFAQIAIVLAAMPAPLAAQSAFEQSVLAELNLARQNPQAYVADLHRYRGFYHANLVVEPGAKSNLMTDEGVAPVDEAISFLMKQKPLSDVAAADPLALAASDLAEEQGADGDTGHAGRNGSTPGDRERRHGGGEYVAEVIAYGSQDAKDVVRQLIIDDGVPDRGHRTVLFDQRLKFAGVSCGSHPVYRTMCVIDLSTTPDGMLDDRHRRSTQIASFTPPRGRLSWTSRSDRASGPTGL